MRRREMLYSQIPVIIKWFLLNYLLKLHMVFHVKSVVKMFSVVEGSVRLNFLLLNKFPVAKRMI